MRMISILLATTLLAGCSQTSPVISNRSSFGEFAYSERDVIPNDTSPPTTQGHVIGPKKVLISVINWQGESTLDAALIEKHTLSTDPDSLRSYILAASGGKLVLTGQVIRQVSGPRPELCKSGIPYPFSLATAEGEKAAQAHGLKTADFDFLINVIDCGGFASAHLWGRIMGVYGQAKSPFIYRHEFGHNLGYGHGSTYTKCPKTDSVVSAPTDCVTTGYGDSGDPVSGGSTLFPAKNRWFSGWLDEHQAGFIERSGLYRLGVLGSSGPQLYVINRPGLDPAQLTLEFRKPTRFDGFPADDNRVTGVWARYSNARGALYNTQLDGTPETATMADPTLQMGKVLKDQTAGITIKVCSASDTGATVSVALNGQLQPSCLIGVLPPSIATPAVGAPAAHNPIVVSGKSLPGAIVAGFCDADIPAKGSEDSGVETVANVNGEWKLTCPTLSPGKHTLYVRQLIGPQISQPRIRDFVVAP
ncbi:transposase [Pseudomonas sp. Sample_24]|uniref:transposase n=1 Tax=Pseudomonas sp. Sample_24 TaxID=2448268 RepID=UPI0010328F8A|nr:transposase [Pseudomonas sp. Sample_24]